MNRSIAFVPLLIATACVACGASPENVRWTLDENPPSLDAPELRLLGFEQQCASGQTAEGRISYELSETDQEVQVTIKIEPRSGDQECPGNPPTPIVVPLRDPLGERRLLDGATGQVIRVQDR